MIGYTFPHNGATVLGIAPSGDADSYVVLVKYGEGDGTEYVTGRVYLHQFPTPESWDNGTYHATVEGAVSHWIKRTCIANEDGGRQWLTLLIRNTERALDAAQKEEA